MRLSVLEHYMRLWGEPARTAAYGPDDAQVYVYKWPAEQTRLGVTMYGTAGEAHSRFRVPRRNRFTCGVTLRTAEAIDRLARLSGIDPTDSMYYNLDGELLIHVFFDDVFREFALPANDRNDSAALSAISDLCEDMIDTDDDDLENAVEVSFLELAYVHRPRTDALLLALGPRCWSRVVEGHEALARRLGRELPRLPGRED